MINLFSLIASQVQNKQDLFDNEGTIMQSLLNSGYHIHEADAALMLMQTLVQKQSDGFFATKKDTSPVVSMRAMNKEERDRITVEAFSFLSKLAHLGIITEDQREELLEKALTTYHGQIDLEDIKSLVTFALFMPIQDRDGSTFAGLRRIKGTAWN